MTLEVGDTDESISHVDRMGNGNRFKKGFVDFHIDGAISPQAVSNQKGGTNDRGGKSVLIGCG